MRCHDSKRINKEEGFALILVLIALIILMLLAMTLSFNAMTDVKISDNHKAAAQAWCLAEEGIQQAKEFMRRNGLDLNQVLSLNKTLLKYLGDSIFAPDTYGYRYPVSLSVARALNFVRDVNGADRFPFPNGVKDGRGILTRGQIYPDVYNDDGYFIKPAAQVRMAGAGGNNYANGYFAVRVVNNLSPDEIRLGGTPFVDKDNRVLIRSIGMVRTFNSDISSGKNNSVVVLEAIVRRDKTMKAIAPVTVVGPDVDGEFDDDDAHKFLFDGYDHRIRFKDNDGNPTPDQARSDIDGITQEGLGGKIPTHGVADPDVDGFGIAGLYRGGASTVVGTLNSKLIAAGKTSRVIGLPGQINVLGGTGSGGTGSGGTGSGGTGSGGTGSGGTGSGGNNNDHNHQHEGGNDNDRDNGSAGATGSGGIGFGGTGSSGTGSGGNSGRRGNDNDGNGDRGGERGKAFGGFAAVILGSSGAVAGTLNGTSWPRCSLGDITTDISSSLSLRFNKDAANNFLNAKNLHKLTKDVRSIAHVIVPEGEIDGDKDPNPFGTVEAPNVVFADGNLTLKGTLKGVGVLVVKGNLQVTGNLHYTGTILVTGGQAQFTASSANSQTVIGGVFLAKIKDNDNINEGDFEKPQLDVRNDVNFYYSSDALRYTIQHLPFETVGFREVRSEYEKSFLSVSVLTKK